MSKAHTPAVLKGAEKQICFFLFFTMWAVFVDSLLPLISLGSLLLSSQRDNFVLKLRPFLSFVVEVLGQISEECAGQNH